ncbi:MAG: hypothetical protein JXR83_03910, partial [Deltaproteobacteria bacterium]|nr:hypothetical protein [Deltaproteobacteria bacterium]
MKRCCALLASALWAACADNDPAPPDELYDLEVSTAGGSAVTALGEPNGTFPCWKERVIHVWSNRARSAPHDELLTCPPGRVAEIECWPDGTAVPPLAWSYNLSRSARFHSAHLLQAECFQHDSPCPLFGDISSRFDPGTECPTAEIPCSCSTGAASCNSPDAAANTYWATRVGYFGTSPRAENIAGGNSDPIASFRQWICEDTANSACGYHGNGDNGHRVSILNSAFERLGVGYYTLPKFYRHIWTQDFGDGTVPTGIVSGVHYPQTGVDLEFRANWNFATAPQTKQVNIEGTCYPMTLERGESANNATYLATVSLPSASCSRYVFHFIDSSGADVFYPSSGSLMVNCGATEYDSTSRPPDCTNVDAGQNDAALPDTALPDAAQPDTTLPDTALPDAAQPDTTLPDTALPDAAPPQDAARPDAAPPQDAARPDTALPDAARPDAAQPDTALPDTAQPDTALPDTAQPDTALPD